MKMISPPPKIAERFDPKNGEFAQETRNHHVERYEFVTQFSGNSYLDLCCGYGYGTNILKQSHPNAQVLGIDIDLPTINRAVEDYPDCSFQIMDIRELYFPNRFDIVVFVEAIEHLTYKEGLAILETIKDQVLTINGTLILSTPRDIQDKYNHYHKSVWTYSTLKNILGSSFDKVQIYGQSWATGKIDEDNVINNDFYVCVCRGE